MSNCLTDLIGIYGCDAPSSVSGVYINQLPGINLESIESVADDEQETYLGVWNDVQERGIRKFKNRLQTELSNRYRLKSLRSTLDLGSIIDTTQTTAPTGQYRGFSYQLKLKNQFRRSNFQALNVQKLRLYLPIAVNTTVKIVNMDTAEVLWTKAVVGTQGWNTIQVNEQFTAERIFFGYDDAGITSVSLPINDSNSDWFNTMYYSLYGYGCCTALLQGAITQDKAVFGTETEVLVTNSNDTLGLSAVFSLVCTFDFLICNNKQLFTTAVWYLLGAEIALEVQYSNRLNRYTTIDKDKAVELEKYCMSEFNNELSIVLDGIQISTMDCCIECNEQIQTFEARM